MTTLALVGGTWGGDWLADGTPFRQYVEARDFTCIPFEGWSGDVDGLPCEFGKNGKHSDWIAGGFALAYFLRGIPYSGRNVIAHSHGGQVIAYCALRTGTPIRNLVTVCTPVRSDMTPAYHALQEVVGHWRHVSAAGWDFFQRAGELADGHFGWQRKMPKAPNVDNVLIKGIGHSRLLNDPEFFAHWEDDGLLDTLRQPRQPWQGVIGV